MPTDQAAIRAALLDASQPVPSGLTDPDGATAGKRFAVYRNNIAVSLTEALRTGFPILRRLLGDDNFDRMAGLYLRAAPPDTPLMMHYGATLPAFLAGFAPLQHIGYLPDVARLELALRRSYHAADAVPIDPARLAAMAPDDLMRARLSFAPALELIRSPWPLFDIWRFNTEDGAPKPVAHAQDVLVLRREFDPEPHPLSPAAGQWLETAHAGAPMGDAQDAALALDPEFDLGALLTLLLDGHAITDISKTPHKD